MKPIPIERADPSRSNYDDWVESDEYYPEMRFDFTSGDLDYLGKHTVHKVSTADKNWIIWKFSWNNGIPTRREKLTGPYDSRAALSWG